MISSEVIQKAGSKVKERLAATPPGSWAKTGVGVLAVTVSLGWLAFPYILDKVVAMQVTLAEGKDSRRLWAQLPAFDFNIYVFNITNPAEVMQGARPAVQEIGPYCYKEVKDKLDFIEDPNSDTISYSARSTWYENQRSENCGAPQLTGEEMLTVPNVPLLAILLIAEKDFPPALLAVVNQALPAIFSRVNDMFLRVSARQLLFGGVPINCSARALYPRTVCIALKQNSRALKKLGRNQYLFSFFGTKNNTPEEFRYTVKRGIQNVQDIGRLVALDGKPELPFWRGECNKIQGTDATVFPPFRKRENGSLTAYSSEVCRSVHGAFEGEVVYKGVTGFGYSIILEDSEANPRDSCFCTTVDRCLKKGALDAFKCQGAPLVVTLPHFYLSSQDYQRGVTGLTPDKEKHGIFIVLEPISGSPLIVRKRLQFSIDMKPINYIPVTQKLRRTLTPIMWAEEKLDLDEDLMGLLEASLFRPMRAVDVIKWVAMVAGVGLSATAVVLKYRNNRRDKVHTLDGEGIFEVTSEASTKSLLTPKDINMNSISDPFYIDVNKTDKDNEEDVVAINGFLKNKFDVSQKESNGVQPLKKKLNLENRRSLKSAPSKYLGDENYTEEILSVSTFLPQSLLMIDGSKEQHSSEKTNIEMKLRESKQKLKTAPRNNSSSLELQSPIISSEPQFSKLSPYHPSIPPYITRPHHPCDIDQGNIPNQVKNHLHIPVERKERMLQTNKNNKLSREIKEIISNANTLVQTNERVQNIGPISSQNGIFRQAETKKSPTQEEIDAVEEDIYKLMVEIAKLIPKEPQYL